MRLLGIADNDLAASVAAAEGRTDRAVAHLRLAVLLEDDLHYDEPPPWYFPEREALGGMLLQANKPAEAEAVFREDLNRHPESGWSLYGLERSLRAQNRAAEAEEVHARFKKAWARADFKPH